jgi:hypothetical protein
VVWHWFAGHTVDGIVLELLANRETQGCCAIPSFWLHDQIQSSSKIGPHVVLHFTQELGPWCAGGQTVP